MSPFSSFDRQPTTQTVAAFVSLTIEVSLLCLICERVWVFLGVCESSEPEKEQKPCVCLCVLDGLIGSNYYGVYSRARACAPAMHARTEKCKSVNKCSQECMKTTTQVQRVC